VPKTFDARGDDWADGVAVPKLALELSEDANDDSSPLPSSKRYCPKPLRGVLAVEAGVDTELLLCTAKSLKFNFSAGVLGEEDPLFPGLFGFEPSNIFLATM
jgi:hypothetical protein